MEMYKSMGASQPTRYKARVVPRALFLQTIGCIVSGMSLTQYQLFLYKKQYRARNLVVILHIRTD